MSENKYKTVISIDCMGGDLGEQDVLKGIIKAYKDQHIIHILVTNYNVNGTNYSFIPLNISCNQLYIDIAFICFPKVFVKVFENIIHPLIM